MPAVKPPRSPRPRRRLWRVPRAVRFGLRWAPTIIVAVVVIGLFILNRTPAGEVWLGAAASRVAAATGALGLSVTNIEVQGRETTDSQMIMAALAATKGTPILSVNPLRAKAQLEALPWVRSAVIERRLPDTIRVRLVERRPLAVWQHSGRHELIDREGTVIPVRDLDRFAKLPIVVGDDAAPHAAKLLEMVGKEPELAPRVSAAVRVGDRRWNLRIDNAIDVLLPETDPAEAWTQLAKLERANGILKRDVQVIDMRLHDRLVVRVNAAPAKEAAPAKKGQGRPAGKST